MKPLTRDLMVVAGLAAAVVVSLVVVRVTAEEPVPTPARITTANAAPLPTFSAPVRTPSPPSPRSVSKTGSSSVAPVDTQQPPSAATLVLSSGAPVDPRLDRTPRTAQPASNPPVTVALLPPPDSPTPHVFGDPAAVAVAWLSALCWYDYREGRDDNTRRAAVYGDIRMPPGQDPWTLDDRAWAQITAAQLSSACTGITAAVETVSHNGTDETMVNLRAAQVLSAAGAAYQSTPISVTRILQRDPDGHWGIGRAVTAN